MESIISEMTVEYLEIKAIIKYSRHGFRNKRSCLTNLLDFFNDVYKMYDNIKTVNIVYLDFKIIKSHTNDLSGSKSTWHN